MTKRNFIILIISMLTPGLSWSQVGGQTSFDFLLLGENARVAALGGELITENDADPNMAFYNPAALNDTCHMHLSINNINFNADIKKQSVSYAHTFRKTGTWGFNAQVINYGTLLGTNTMGSVNGTFGAKDWALTLSKSHTIKPFTLGLNLRYAASRIDIYSANAFMFDIGGIWQHPRRDFRIGMVFKNIGFALSNYNPDIKSNTPVDIQLGLSYKLEHMPLRFIVTTTKLYALDIVYLDPLRDTEFNEDGVEVAKQKSLFDKVARHFVFGGEFIFSKHLFFRVGYNYLRRRELRLQNISGGAGFSFGMKLKVNRFEFNFSRAFYHVIGGNTVLTFTSDLDQIWKKRKPRTSTIEKRSDD